MVAMSDLAQRQATISQRHKDIHALRRAAQLVERDLCHAPDVAGYVVELLKRLADELDG